MNCGLRTPPNRGKVTPALVALEDYLEARGVSSLKDAPVKDPLMASVKDPMKFIGYRALYLTVHTWLRNAINASLIPSAERQSLADRHTGCDTSLQIAPLNETYP